jgi:hypothetical protein
MVEAGEFEQSGDGASDEGEWEGLEARASGGDQPVEGDGRAGRSRRTCKRTMGDEVGPDARRDRRRCLRASDRRSELGDGCVDALGFALRRRYGLVGGEVAGAPQVPGGDGAEGVPLFGTAFHDVGSGEEVRGDLGGGLEALEGEGEAFAYAVVGGGEDVRAAEAEDEEHFDGPGADAADPSEVVDDGCVVHAADLCQGGNSTVEGFGGEVAEGEGFVGGEAGGAEFGGGGVEDLLGGGVVGGEGGHGLESGDETGVDGGGGLAVKLLVDDGFGEGFEGGLLRGEAHGEGAGAGDEPGESGVGGGEMGEGGGAVVGKFGGLARGVRHEVNDRCSVIELGLNWTEFTSD